MVVGCGRRGREKDGGLVTLIEGRGYYDEDKDGWRISSKSRRRESKVRGRG